MLLKVGELARRSGVTVRALHHYDSIGLLRPSGRSESGYRLYDRDDVARLHGIQALRGMGVPLAEVARLLEGGADAMQALLARQLVALEASIARTQALRDRVGLMQTLLAGGGQPDIDDWLGSLEMMSDLEQHFSLDELKAAFERGKQLEPEWMALMQPVREAMARRVASDALELQPLVQQWMDLAARWMEGDADRLSRWRRIVRARPTMPLPQGMDAELREYVHEAIRHRMEVLAKYVGLEEQHRLDGTLRPEWRALGERAERLIADGEPPQSDAARALARDWLALLDRMVGHDPDLRARVIAAYENEPLLQAGLVFSAAARAYVRQALRA